MDKFNIEDIIRIQDAIRNQNLVLFVGAGVSKNSGVPLWGELLARLRTMMSYNPHGISNNLQLAELVKKDLGEDKYNSILSGCIDAGYQPNILHQLIFSLQPRHIITTNYDTLLEQAAQEEFDGDFNVCSADADFSSPNNVHMLIKMHGDFKSGNITFTSTDYRQYSDLKPLTEGVVKTLMATNVVLMVGVSFEDDHVQDIVGFIKDKSGSNSRLLYVLLTDVNHGQAEFYKSLGAKIIWVSEEYIKPYETEYNWSSEYSALKDFAGIELYKQLRFIRDYKRNIDIETLPEFLGNWNVIGYLYEQIKPVVENVPYLYGFIKHLWEEEFRKTFSYNANNVVVDSQYVKQLADNFDTIAAKRRLLQSKQLEITFLRNFAIANNIYRVDRLPLFSSASWRRRHRNYIHSNSIIDKFFNFGSPDIGCDNIENLTGTSSDLLLPYAYYLNNKFAEAIKQYEHIYDKCKRCNQVLALICRISICNLKNPAYWQLQQSLQPDKLTQFKQKYEVIDIQREILKAKIPEGLKNIFLDIVNYSTNLIGLRDSSALLSEVINDRNIAANGGFSCNSHANKLECLLFNDVAFYINNCIVGDNNSYATQSRVNIIAGLLVSHNIEQKYNDSKYSQPSKKEKISSLEVLSMLFMISHSSLEKIIKTYDIRKIVFDDDAILYIDDLCINLSKHKVNADVYESPLLNLLEVLILSDNYFKEGKSGLLLDGLTHNVDLLQNHNCYQLIHKTISRRTISLEHAAKLLFVMRSSRRIYTGMSDVVRDVAEVYLKHKTVCPIINSLSDMNYDKTENATLHELERIAYYYPIVKSHVKRLILSELRAKANYWSGLMYTIADIAYWGIPVFDKQLLALYLKYLDNHCADDPMHSHLFLVLLKVYSNTRSSTMRAMIDEYVSNCGFLQFMREPFVYPKKEIKPIWITWCEPQVIQQLFAEKILRNKMIEYIKSESDYRVEILKDRLTMV